MRFATWTILLCGLSCLPASAAEPWSTYRGNAQRSGNADGKAGPAKPDVLWAHKGQDHYIASPVPLGDRLFVSGFSGFNLPTVAAPVAVVGGRVLVCSAYLDKEKVGDRALFSLDAATGKIQWRTPLQLNPWGGPAVQGDVVVVGGSSVAYDPGALKGAKGEVAAFDLTSGKEK